MMGDGNFKWWWGYGSQPEICEGPFDSKEDAIDAARGSVDGRSFTVLEADKSVATTNVFDAEMVFDQFDEANEACWGEDGCEIDATAEEQRDLEVMLGAALEAWFRKHKKWPVTWAFGEQRGEEFFPAPAIDARSDETPQEARPSGESAVGAAEAPIPSLNPQETTPHE